MTGPFEVFVRARELKVHVVAISRDPVIDANGLSILPTATFGDCPQADILFVPGGPGQLALMRDRETLAFLKAQAQGTRYVTSVCTGSLILAAAGLLTGYRATCHWMSLQQLAHFGVEPVSERVVVDRDRITGAGVTSGIDFGLTLIAELFGSGGRSSFSFRWNMIQSLRSRAVPPEVPIRSWWRSSARSWRRSKRKGRRRPKPLHKRSLALTRFEPHR